MVAFDTNVVVRLLVGDDPRQTRAAEQAFLEHAAEGGVFVSLIVLAEVGWVLTAAYGWDRATIHRQVGRLVRTRGVFVEELELVEQALEAFASGRANLADYLIVGKARSAGARLATFDKTLAKEAGATLL